MTDFAVIANWYTKEGICKEVPPRKFLTVMRSTGVNRWSDWAVGNKHLTDEQLRNGQTEKDAMTAFHEFLVELREEGEEGRNFVYIAGHNVDSFDLPHINRAFGRAGLTLDGVVDGVVDTLRLSRMYINWTEVAAMPKLPPTTSMLLVGPAVLAEEQESSEHEDENEGGMQATSVTPLTAVDATDFSTLGAAIKRGKVAGNKVAIKVEQHNLGNCHARLFGVGLGDHAHEASADAYAVVAILSHPAVWPLLVDEEVWRPVSSIVKHADGLYAAEINRVRGWRREYRPVCDHGVMLTTVVAVHEELERAMFTDGHKVVFKCRMRFKPCRDPVEEVTYPGYVVTAATKVPRSGSKVSTAVPKGTAGACECSSMCVRGCPCKNVGPPVATTDGPAASVRTLPAARVEAAVVGVERQVAVRHPGLEHPRDAGLRLRATATATVMTARVRATVTTYRMVEEKTKMNLSVSGHPTAGRPLLPTWCPKLGYMVGGWESVRHILGLSRQSCV